MNRRSAVGEIGRFLVPLDAPAALQWFRRNLYFPRNGRARVFNALGHVPLRRVDPARALTDSALLRELMRDQPELAGRAIDATDWILLRDYDDKARERVIAFLFDRGAGEPFAVVKAQKTVPGGEANVRHEGEAVEQMRALLPPRMRHTVPVVLRLDVDRRGELLATSVLPGRSGSVEVQSSLLPHRHVEQHFDRAARWLAEFHTATRTNAELEIGGKRLSMSACHGDFWIRNVLYSEDTIGVVDWEQFTPSAPPFVDLFHFAIGYGLSYPWHGYRRADHETWFRRTFVERNRVSRAAHASFVTYCTLTGIDPKLLGPAFREFVETRGCMGTQGAPGSREFPWEKFAQIARDKFG